MSDSSSASSSAAAVAAAANPLLGVDPSAAELRILGGHVRCLVGHSAPVTQLAWSSDGVLASASADATVRLWRFEGSPPAPRGEAKVLRGHDGEVSALAWSPTERHLLATAGSDNSLRLWDTRDASGRVDALLPVPAMATSLSWKPDGSTIAMGTDTDEIVLIDVRGGRPALLGSTRLAPTLQLNAVAWTPSGLLFTVCTYTGAALDEGHLIVFRVGDDGKSVVPVHTATAHTMGAYALSFSRDFRHFVTGGADSIVGLWETSDVTCIRTFDRAETYLRGVALSHDVTMLTAACEDRALEITRVMDGTRVRAIPQAKKVECVAWHPTAHVLAWANEDKPREDSLRAPPRADQHAVRVLVPSA